MPLALRLDHGPGLKPPCRPDYGVPGYPPGREIRFVRRVEQIGSFADLPEEEDQINMALGTALH